MRRFIPHTLMLVVGLKFESNMGISKGHRGGTKWHGGWRGGGVESKKERRDRWQHLKWAQKNKNKNLKGFQQEGERKGRYSKWRKD